MDKNTWALAQKAETLSLSGAYEQAIEIFEELQKSDSDNAWINAHLGKTYYQLMDYAKAEKYLKKAVKKNDNYLWAHAHLGETYRLRAITENDKKPKNKSIDSAIQHFEKALADKAPENSEYGWALAHLGATYRLKITLDKIKLLEENEIDQESKKQALNYLNRAIELMPTYAWAWGMRSTVHRLAQEYEESFWDLGVETQISPDLETLQHSPSPVPFLVSRRVSLYEHAFLFFYLTKREDNSEKKERYYSAAIACTQQVLILKPGDLIGQLILKIIEGTQKKENNGIGDELDDDFIKECHTVIKKIDAKLADICKAVLIYMIKAEPKTKKKLEKLAKQEVMSGHKLKKLVDDVLNNSDLDNPEIEVDPQLWLWQNFAWVEGSASVLSFLADLSNILKSSDEIYDDITGEAWPYRVLALIIYDQYALERLVQTPTLSEAERVETFKKLLLWVKSH
ncbi:tetratricopeptide repeat protein [Moorena producens JHB]|uniref:Tetratricopeptide repeat protein n=1 Tax=Moorena producens (strain JHB) TaxID=1454205 RepID=A0A1D9G6D5_MOOP1|nr:tetratricopeptide repeat protein [Moorena producens]AOY83055.1 tetratricopeptide repeat protein [Moorena producens JHB]